MANIGEAEGRDDLNIREGRSPNFPYIPLKQALERARSLRKGIVRNEARLATVGTVWSMGTKSSALRQTIAALKHFGLVEYVGAGADRKIKLTDAAHRIILDDRPESPEREELIKKAALLPKLHSQLWQKWGADLPPDVEMRAELNLEQGFSQTGAMDAVAVYRGTLAFAKLIESGRMPDEQQDNSGESGSQMQTEREKVTALHQQPPRTATATVEERIVYKPGQDIFLRFTVEPDAAVYDFLKDYLEFRLARIEKEAKSKKDAE